MSLGGEYSLGFRMNSDMEWSNETIFVFQRNYICGPTKLYLCSNPAEDNKELFSLTSNGEYCRVRVQVGWEAAGVKGRSSLTTEARLTAHKPSSGNSIFQ